MAARKVELLAITTKGKEGIRGIAVNKGNSSNAFSHIHRLAVPNIVCGVVARILRSSNSMQPRKVDFAVGHCHRVDPA